MGMVSFAIGQLLFRGALGYLCDRHSKKNSDVKGNVEEAA